MKGVGKSRLIVYVFEFVLQVLFTLYLLLHLFIVLARRKGNDDESQHSPVPPAGERAKPDRGEEKATVQNVFINYHNKHIGCEKHIANWRRHRNLPLNVGEKKTLEPQVNHRAEIDAACAIVEKVRCVYCGSKFELVPSKRNLEHNLQEHLSSEKHQENVEFQLCSTSHSSVRSSAKGRPKKFDPKDLKRQRCIDSFLVGAQSSGSVSNPSSTEDCKKEPSEVHSDLSLLCWRFWFTSTIVYGGNVYDVKPLLDDQKRGCTWLDNLTIPKLRAQAQYRARVRRKEQIELFRLKRRVCTLMSRTCKVAQIAGESAKRKDIDYNFEEVAKILTAAKALHGITGGVAVILAKDETWVKPTVRWEARRDTLIGFCGDKDNHVCKMGLEVEVGSGESGYSKIVESFEQKIQGLYARVVIVNPLHEKLPRLIVYASITCNSFTASWVRDHWKGLKQRWDKYCRQVLGPVLGHANDGDARRRKLMLEDYLGSEGQRIFRDKFPGMALPLHLLGSDSCEQFFSCVGGMRGYERNYDFGDLLDCASGLNCLAVLEYGEDVIKLSKVHVKHRPLWAKLHPLSPGHAKPDLSDFARLAKDDQIIDALKVGLQQAQTLLTQLNMSPHAGVRNKTWWRTPWTLERELGIFGTSSSTEEPDHERFEVNEVEEVEEMPNSKLSSDLWDIPEATGALSTMEADVDAEGDETNDLEVYGHEACHVMSETMSTLLMEHAPTNRKVDPMVSYEGHEMYKASLVNLLVGNPTLSKDCLNPHQAKCIL
ncbi:hypothetical protein R1flu_024139 [Riccia fluitans]|uniref:C2H2-type domain-containing protein n=1 Tax=Riccia fluitans TaxID=41844 RepID=A0ABD1XU76_9MARC